MKKLIFTLLLVLFSLPFVGEAFAFIQQEEYNLTIVYHTDEGQQESLYGSNFDDTFDYGDEVSIDFSALAELKGMTFAFFVHNANVHFDIESTIQITTDATIHVFLKEETEIIAAFLDTNGEILATNYLTEAAVPAVTLETTPTKPGLVFSGWDKQLEVITEDTVYFAHYQSSSPENSVLVNGVQYAYNSVVTLVSENPEFTHWEEDGKVVSYNPTYKFTALDDRTITEKTDGEEREYIQPTVTIKPYYNLREGYESYVGQYEMTEGYTFVEAGFIYSTDYMDWIPNPSDPEFTGFVKSTAIHAETNEFLRSFNDSNTYYGFYAYIVASYEYEGEVYFSTFYSDFALSEKKSYLERVMPYVTDNFELGVATKYTYFNYGHDVVYDMYADYENKSFYQYYRNGRENYDSIWYQDGLVYTQYGNDEYLYINSGYSFEYFAENFNYTLEEMFVFLNRGYNGSGNVSGNSVNFPKQNEDRSTSFTFHDGYVVVRFTMYNGNEATESHTFTLYYDRDAISDLQPIPEYEAEYNVGISIYVNGSHYANEYLEFNYGPTKQEFIKELNRILAYYDLDDYEVKWFNGYDIELTEETFDFSMVWNFQLHVTVPFTLEVYNHTTYELIDTVSLPFYTGFSEFISAMEALVEPDQVFKVILWDYIIDESLFDYIKEDLTITYTIYLDTDLNNDKTIELFYDGYSYVNYFADDTKTYQNMINWGLNTYPDFRFSGFYFDEAFEVPFTEDDYNNFMADEKEVYLQLYIETVEFPDEYELIIYLGDFEIDYTYLYSFDGVTVEEIETFLMETYGFVVEAIYDEDDDLMTSGTSYSSYFFVDVKAQGFYINWWPSQFIPLDGLTYEGLLDILDQNEYVLTWYIDEARTVLLTEATFSALTFDELETKVIYPGLSTIENNIEVLIKDTQYDVTFRKGYTATNQMTVTEFISMVNEDLGMSLTQFWLDEELTIPFTRGLQLDEVSTLYTTAITKRQIVIWNHDGQVIYDDLTYLTWLEGLTPTIDYVFEQANVEHNGYYAQIGYYDMGLILDEHSFEFFRENYYYIRIYPIHPDSEFKTITVVDQDTSFKYIVFENSDYYEFESTVNTVMLYELNTLYAFSDLTGLVKDLYNLILTSQVEEVTIYATRKEYVYIFMYDAFGNVQNSNEKIEFGQILELIDDYGPIATLYKYKELDVPLDVEEITANTQVHIKMNLYQVVINYPNNEVQPTYVPSFIEYEAFISTVGDGESPVYLDAEKTILLTVDNFEDFINSYNYENQVHNVYL